MHVISKKVKFRQEMHVISKNEIPCRNALISKKMKFRQEMHVISKN